jgi:heme exporter protein C
MKNILYYTILYILLATGSYMAFIFAPPIEGLGYTGQILYLHVPAAWMAVLSFLISGNSAAVYLFTKKENFAMSMHSCAEIGILFITAALVSGSIWAHTAWGTFWNWDVRETSVLIILLIYIGYFAIPVKKETGRIPNAGYLIIATAIMPIFVFIIPRIYPTLHPSPIVNQSGSIDLETPMRIALFFNLFVYTILFVTIFNLRNRIAKLEKNGDK